MTVRQRTRRPPSPASPASEDEAEPFLYRVDDVVGHETAKRALEAAASGDHPVALVASEGQGKTMLLEVFWRLTRRGRHWPPIYHHEYGWREFREEGDLADAVRKGYRPSIVVLMPDLTAADWSLPPPREPHEAVAGRVEAARERAGQRGRLDMNPEARKLMTAAFERLRFSPRDAVKVEAVAGTLAHMESAPHVARIHVAEALSYYYKGNVELKPQGGTA